MKKVTKNTIISINNKFFIVTNVEFNIYEISKVNKDGSLRKNGDGALLHIDNCYPGVFYQASATSEMKEVNDLIICQAA